MKTLEYFGIERDDNVKNNIIRDPLCVSGSENNIFNYYNVYYN